MKHATNDTLDRISDVLEAIATHVPPLREKKRGTYYYKSAAFLHVNDDPVGVFADLKVDGDWVRYCVTQPDEMADLLYQTQTMLAM